MINRKMFLTLAFIVLPVLAGATSPGSIEGPIGPHLADFSSKAISPVPVINAGQMDIYQSRSEAEDTVGEAPRFADPVPVSITPETHGTWVDLDERFQLWQLRVSAPGALSLNFGFDGFELPKGARLTVYPADLTDAQDKRGVRVFTERDNSRHGELWTPVVVSDEIIIELLIPTLARADYRLHLTSINKGFRFLGDEVDKSGSCNIDVVCSEGDDWWSEINSVGVYTINGTWYCTGAVVNNTAQDGTPYFLTADHCDISSSNDQGVVIYWNFQSPNCGDQGGGPLTQFSSGVTYLASSSTSDFCLVEINDPLDPAFGVTFSGWDRSGGEHPSAVAIHHPSTDEKSISFEFDPTTTTSYLSNSVPGNGTHVRIEDWDLGTTEPGSSGSPLYSPEHRIIGQLHGGYAACGNNSSDWYGKFSVTWPGLSQWLDPLNTGAETLDTLDPNATGIAVSAGNLIASGDSGGPFTPDSQQFTVTNNGDSAIDFSVTENVSWAEVTDGNGTLAPGDEAIVTVSLNSNANSLPNGGYSGILYFNNLTDGEGDSTRDLILTVGVPSLVYSENLDSDPNWDLAGLWAYGQPTGGGGQYGNPDPTSGHTSNNVLGYNLAGDYENSLPETHLTSTAFNCSAIIGTTLKFWRHLNVEQPSYDHASISVSNDGENFTQIWTNNAVVEDDSWTQHEFDISEVADGQTTVYLRWTMGETDGSWQFSGWNIDDIEIWGVSSGAESPVEETPIAKLSLGNYPNPFNPLTRVKFNLEKTDQAFLAVYDLQGRLVRNLINETMSEGSHSIIWDGTDNHGQRVGSGVYFARLVSGDQTADHKMVLLK